MVISGQQLLFPSVCGKKVIASFTGGLQSSDGGLLLLKQLDARLGLTAGLARCLSDDRQQSKVHQSTLDMLVQRIYGIACGYEDCNDFDTLRDDPLFKLSADRLPASGMALASQPTLSRFENSVDIRSLLRMAHQLVQQFIDGHHGKPPSQIILDLDATEDPAHGQQEFEFYHGYYGCHCFLPLLVYATVARGEQEQSDQEGSDQELIGAVLRPGNKHAGHGAVSILKRIVAKLREAFPECRFIVRGDAGFALPALYDWCEKVRVDYVISLAKNARLLELAAPWEKEARALYGQTEQKVRHFGAFEYQAKSWEQPRRVIVKAEMLSKGFNPRFVVTNLPGDDPVLDADQKVYDFYTERGDVENRIKELKLDLRSGRTSCHRFLANQFRLFLHAAALVLMQQLRRLLSGKPQQKWQAGTVRLKLLKVGALVTQSVRRIAIKLSSSYPYQELWQHLALQR